MFTVTSELSDVAWDRAAPVGFTKVAFKEMALTYACACAVPGPDADAETDISASGDELSEDTAELRVAGEVPQAARPRDAATTPPIIQYFRTQASPSLAVNDRNLPPGAARPVGAELQMCRNCAAPPGR
jgi:hypothetical protein